MGRGSHSPSSASSCNPTSGSIAPLIGSSLASTSPSDCSVFCWRDGVSQCLWKVTEPWTARQQCKLSVISEFTTDIQHVVGKHNLVADCLSRTVARSIHLGLDYVCMAADQVSDSDVQALRTATAGLQLEDLVFDDTGTTVLCDVFTGQKARSCSAVINNVC